METTARDIPILFFNTGSEDREAYLLMKSSGVRCEFRAPSIEEFSPLLLVGYQRFIGLDEIKYFIKRVQRSKAEKH